MPRASLRIALLAIVGFGVSHGSIAAGPTTVTQTETSSGRTQIFPGHTAPLRAPKPPLPPGTSTTDVTLDFVNADVKEVVRAVLGDILKVPYVIDPNVSGRITLTTSGPLHREDIMPSLETALKAAGAAITFSNGLYAIVPANGAPSRVEGVATPGTPGLGIEIVPLRYIAAPEMQKLLQPFASEQTVVRIDAARNLIFLSGTAQERAALRETIALFDVDWLEGMSYALVRPQHVDVQTLADELKNVFANEGSPIAGLVRFLPIERLNTLLVVSPQERYLRQVARWVDRLDVVKGGPGRRIYYYRLQNARAKDIASTLGAFFGISTTSSSSDTSSPAAPAASSAATAPATSSASPASQPAQDQHAYGVGAMGNGPQIVTDETHNALLIRVEPEDYPAIEAIIREMDVAPDQVLIEATLAEVNLNDQLKYGVEWFFQNGNATGTFSPTGTVSANFPGVAFTYMVPNASVAISALSSITGVKVVSSPKIMTLDNHSASIQVGDQVPIITQSAVSVTNPEAPVVNAVQFRDTGVVLTVTPRIGNSGLVTLEISQEVSGAVPTTTSGIDSPTIQQRRIEATVAVQDGATIVLGGMIRESQTTGAGGIPFLNSIPVIGDLLGNRSRTSDRTELLVFLTPHVIRSNQQAQRAADELRKAMESLNQWLSQMPSAQH